MNILSGELAATKNYTSRTWVWVGRSDAADLADGTLTVTTTTGKTRRCTPESRRYLVQEVAAEGTPDRREFLYLKPDAEPYEGESDIYKVVVFPNGLTHCTCKAASCRVGNCVHRDAAAALVAAGAFDDGLPACFRGVGGSREGCPF